MSDLEILTDIKIPQCPIWQNRVDYLFNNNKKKRFLSRFNSLLRNCVRYDIVVTANIKTAQLFGLYRTIFRLKRPKHIILELMLDEERDDFLWKVKLMFQRLCFSSVDLVFVSSRGEIATYSKRLRIPKERIRFLPFHTNIVEPRMLECSGGYIFSAGKTDRDFATLAAAVEGLGVQVVLVSDKYHVEGIKFPSNVEIHCDIPYKKYLDFLYDCSLVVVPLKKSIKSTGQVVFLEAMALGKPVIASDVVGTEDYIENGKAGILVPPEDVHALRHAIENFIEKPNSYQSMAEKALEQIRERHTFKVYTQTILNIADKIADLDK